MINIVELSNCKENIKNAIVEKGVEVTSGMVDYGTYIRNIPGKAILKLPKNTVLGESTFTKPPAIDTRHYTSMRSMFHNCVNLKLVDYKYDTSKVTNMWQMFMNCENLEAIKVVFDCSKVNNVYQMFYGCTKLYNVYGFMNLGQSEEFYDAGFISDCNSLSKYSVRNIFNNLYDRASAGYSVVTIYLHPDVYAKLTDDDIAIATNKGWGVAF